MSSPQPLPQLNSPRRKFSVLVVTVSALVLGGYLFFRFQPSSELKDAGSLGLETGSENSDARTTVESHGASAPVSPLAHASARPSDPPIHYTKAQFQDLTAKTMEVFPPVKSLKSMAEVEMVLESGRKLGEISRALKSYPELVPEGAKFYHDCIEAEDKLPSMRSLCYAKLKVLNEKERLGFNLDAEPVPDSIRRLGNLMPGDWN
jgi:hypothetical protein